jgi:hypothetical protein
MSPRILGIVVLVVGLILLAFGLNSTESAAESVKETFTGRYTDRTMWYLIGGVALALLGGGIAIMGRRPQRG